MTPTQREDFYFLIAQCIRVAMNFVLVCLEYKFGFHESDSYLGDSIQYDGLNSKTSLQESFLQSAENKDSSQGNSQNFYIPRG